MLINKKQNMIPFKQALSIIEQLSFSPATEPIVYTQSLHRVLAQDILSDIDMPPFHKSAMDGYAVLKLDLDNGLRKFKILKTIAAGDNGQYTLNSGQCYKIMTGAALPTNADFVIKVEDTTQEENDWMQVNFLSTHHNICFKGEDVTTGAVVLNKKSLIKPQDIAVMAAVGCTKLIVYCKPKIAVFSTGTELIEPENKPENAQIRNSNSYQILTQLQRLGTKGDYLGIIPDDYAITEKKILAAVQNYDLIVLSGGVSAGDFDWIPQILKDNNFTICFHQLAVKPGKPTLLAKKDNKIVFGLPGNPVSSFIIFELLVKKIWFAMQGFAYHSLILKVPAAFDFQRRNTERLYFMPVQINADGCADAITYHGSGHIHALCNAQAVVLIETGQTGFKKGDLLNVRLL